MKFLLVRPNINKKIITVKNIMFGEPLGIECVSTILKEQGHEVLVADFMAESKRNFKRYLQEFKPDVVGFTSQCSDVNNILIMAAKVKALNNDITVLIGGVQATITPEAYFNEHIDYVFKATTRENITLLVEQIENQTRTEIMGVYSKILDYKSTLQGCTNEYVKADRSSTGKYRHQYKYVGYQPCAILQTSYGCRNHCSFCVRWRLEGGKLVEIPIEQIVDEIESLEECNVMICDNDFLINEERLSTFLDLLEARNIKKTYICYGSVASILEKEYLFERLSKNGLKAVIVGYESFNDELLQKWNKKATTDDNDRATRVLKKSGIACWGSFIIHPDFTKADFRQMYHYYKELKPELLTFSPLVPHPLTPLYNEYEERLIYKKEDYEKWNFGDVVIAPREMSLRKYYFEMFKLGIMTNLNLFTLNYLFRTFSFKNTMKLTFGANKTIYIYFKYMMIGR